MTNLAQEQDMDIKTKMHSQIAEKPGFIAALDQSGGSTPKALKLYGIEESAYGSEEDMFDLVHAMRTRIIKSAAFSGEKIIGAILFEMTMDRDIDGIPTAQYLWQQKGVVPFLKVDKGLADEDKGVQVMKPMPALDSLCARAVAAGIFGTKMRSVINSANPEGIKAVVNQQFDVAEQILAHGLMPIVEPEVNIHAPDKAECETLLRQAILDRLETLPEGQQVMLKLTLPDEPNFYAPLIAHPKILRVVALSGGYSREEANNRLTANNGMIASFSRALSEGLNADQSDTAFDEMIAASINDIFEASKS